MISKIMDTVDNLISLFQFNFKSWEGCGLFSSSGKKWINFLRNTLIFSSLYIGMNVGILLPQ